MWRMCVCVCSASSHVQIKPCDMSRVKHKGTLTVGAQEGGEGIVCQQHGIATFSLDAKLACRRCC